MAFNQPPNTPPGPAAPPPPAPTRGNMTLAQTSAMGTTAGAPVMTSKGPPGGSGLPGSGPPPIMPGQNQQPPAVGAKLDAPQITANPGPPAGGPVVANPVVAPHGGQRSIGTHPSRSPSKRVNPTHGMFK